MRVLTNNARQTLFVCEQWCGIYRHLVIRFPGELPRQPAVAEQMCECPLPRLRELPGGVRDLRQEKHWRRGCRHRNLRPATRSVTTNSTRFDSTLSALVMFVCVFQRSSASSDVWTASVCLSVRHVTEWTTVATAATRCAARVRQRYRRRTDASETPL